MPRIGDDGNAASGAGRHERAGTVGAGATPPAAILLELLPEPDAAAGRVPQ